MRNRNRNNRPNKEEETENSTQDGGIRNLGNDRVEVWYEKSCLVTTRQFENTRITFGERVTTDASTASILLLDSMVDSVKNNLREDITELLLGDTSTISSRVLAAKEREINERLASFGLAD
ncbi:MAG: hypothetical protein ACRDBG_24355 [Waterburya sp.]